MSVVDSITDSKPTDYKTPNKLVSSIRKKYREFQNTYPDESSLKVAYLFLNRMISIFFRLMMARYYLRNCTEVGKLVTTKLKPMVKNKGKIIIGDEVAIWSVFEKTKFLVHPKGHLKIGYKSRINGVHLSVKHSVVIGNHVRIGPYTLIMDSDFHDIYERDKEGKQGEVVIGDHVWIASKVIILKGVKIGKGSMIAAGSVVTKDIPSYSMAAGVPAKVIKKLNMS